MKDHAFKTTYGPWALITGAAMGLGAQFARQCAARGLNLLLIDREGKELRELAGSIEDTTGREVQTMKVDLSRPEFLKEIRKKSDYLDIGLLVNNAGESRVSPFLDLEPDFLANQVQVNVRAPLLLTRHFAPLMKERGRGGIIFLSSGSANVGTGYAANYAGTKAWNLIVAESLWYELSPYNVDVLGYMPGATESPGWYANDPFVDAPVQPMPAEPAVAEALDALGKKPSVATGWKDKLGTVFMRMAPRKTAIETVSRTMEKTFPATGVREKGN